MARAFRSFRDGDGSEDDWIGALAMQQIAFDLHEIKSLLVAFASRGRK